MIIDKIIKKYKGFTYKTLNRFKLDGLLVNAYEKIAVHIDKNKLDHKDVISMIRYCKLNKITTLMIVTDICYDWIDALVKYNDLEYLQLSKNNLF